MDLTTPVAKISHVYKMYAGRLEKLGIFTLGDFLYHIPFRYEDFSLVSKISNLQAGETVTIKGTIEKIDNTYTRKWKTLQKAQVIDETGKIDILWFNQPFLTRVIKIGDLVSISGKVELDKNKPTMISPDYEVIFNDETIHTGRLVPVYPETKGISSKWLRRQVFNLLPRIKEIREYLPQELIDENNLLDLETAISEIHFPKSFEEAKKAKERLAFDELFEMQLSAIVRKKLWEKKKLKKPWEIEKYKHKIDDFIKKIPFELTNAQKIAYEEILKDLSSDKPMNRLLEGDVGSGKTIVAAITSYVAFLNGFQTAFMAPTEILANQHFETLKKLFNSFGVSVELLTGSTKKIEDNFNILIGTHAIIYKKTEFKKLGFIVIDEQQRFGVEQRGILRAKGDNPHLLTMTATPIPRTVALAMYGDLDLSILDEMPKERLKVKTWLVPPIKRTGAYKWIEKQVTEYKDQVFIVCPFIEESETMISIKAATKEFERLKTEVFPKLNLGLMHGKLKSNEKEDILNKFRDGKIDILVSTPVVEVGIDIKNASVMLIEEAERFGLAQLHQLRGRVGRGTKQSYCLLFTQSKNPQTLERLRALETIYSGATLAELDLKLRGPGQIYGTSQHGIPQLKVASFSDFNLIEKTKREAEKIFPEIDKYKELKEKIEKISLTQVSPD
jgi:ATP-dependent DNA helicase RecG